MQATEFFTAKQYPESIEAYSRAISLDPKKSANYVNRALAYNLTGEFDKAEADCKLLLLKDAKNPKAYLYRAVARQGLGRLREARADVDMALKLDPAGAEAIMLAARIKAQIAKQPKPSVEDVLNF